MSCGERIVWNRYPIHRYRANSSPRTTRRCAHPARPLRRSWDRSPYSSRARWARHARAPRRKSVPVAVETGPPTAVASPAPVAPPPVPPAEEDLAARRKCRPYRPAGPDDRLGGWRLDHARCPPAAHGSFPHGARHALGTRATDARPVGRRSRPCCAPAGRQSCCGQRPRLTPFRLPASPQRDDMGSVSAGMFILDQEPAQ